MKGKWNFRIGILVILLIFGVYLRIHRRSASYIRRYKLLNIPDSTHIVGIDIVSRADTVILKKENGKWVIVSKDRELPANAKKVENLAAKFASAEYQVAGLNTKDMQSYGINDSSSIVTIRTDLNKERSLIIGKRGPTYSSFYFVFPDRKKIYLLMGIPLYTVSAHRNDYREKSVVNLKITDIKAFTLISGKDTLLVTRSGDTFQSVPQKDTSTIKGVLNRARVLTAFSFADAEPDSITGIKSSNKRVVFVTQQDDTIIITVGKKGKYALYVSVNKRPGEVFKVYRSWFDEVLKKAGILTGSDT